MGQQAPLLTFTTKEAYLESAEWSKGFSVSFTFSFNKPSIVGSYGPLVTLVAIMTVQVPLHDSGSMTTTRILPVRVDHAFKEWSRSKDFER